MRQSGGGLGPRPEAGDLNLPRDSLLKPAVLVPQGNVHVNFAALGAEAEDDRFRIFAALRSSL